MRSIFAFALVASLSFGYASMALAGGGSTYHKPINGSDLPMTDSQARKIALEMLSLGNRYPQIVHNSVRMNAECIAAKQHSGMCKVFHEITRMIGPGSSADHI